MNLPIDITHIVRADLAAQRRARYWRAWLDGFITAEVIALIGLVIYGLAKTF